MLELLGDSMRVWGLIPIMGYVIGGVSMGAYQ